ncbi:MAG: glycogen/starch/alpha-glucan phosphorylase [Geminicoccaceae bacterium]
MTQITDVLRPTDVEGFRALILEKLVYAVGKEPRRARDHDWLIATALATRDHVVQRWIASTNEIWEGEEKRVYYLSLEFLIGRLLTDTLTNLELYETCDKALEELGVSLHDLRELEPDAALGNGGLGRLAACFMESMASVGIAGYGYGIRYEHGLFRQGFVDGWQIERPEDWLTFGNPWEFERPEVVYEIGFGGRVEDGLDGSIEQQEWTPHDRVLAIAYDTPIVGWQGKRVNTLRLWSADAGDLMRLDEFNRGDYVGSLAHQISAQAISRVLYPDDSMPAGQELRLKQEYFFTSASLQDLLRRHIQRYKTLDNFSDKVSIQRNDTHPALAVPELMRLLIDVHGLHWDRAWQLTQAAISYTNHTLLPEALETWPAPLMEQLLPRHMQIVYELNARILETLRKRPDNEDPFLTSVSIIDEAHGRRVRMGNLAFIGAHKINGVSALHSDLVKETVFADLNRFFPGRITNKTNGITPRRWLRQCNPELSQLLIETIGDAWVGDLEKIEALEAHADDASFQERFARAKRVNKEKLAAAIADRLELKVDPQAIFDAQIKRIHEYKRQLLNIIEAVALHNAIRAQPHLDWQPRVKIFAGKAAAAYHRAKLIIKLINDVARIVNRDPLMRDRLKIVFLPNYNVSLAEKIIPAADVSEQISTAGMEASGTGNMKFALNGAMTIGTADGANIEIRDRVGEENIVMFGLSASEVDAHRADGYQPANMLERQHALAHAVEAIGSGVYSPDEPGRFRELVDGLKHHDHFMVTADFESYYAGQRQLDRLYADRSGWLNKTILNTARMGWFSSDRTIREYGDEIWQLDR